MPIGRDLLVLLPQLLTVVTAVLALAAEMARRPRWALGLTVVGLLAATGLAVTRLGEQTTVFQGTYRIDTLSTWAAIILLPATVLAAVLIEPEARVAERHGVVYPLLTFTTIGALVLAGAGDIIFLVLGVLLSSLGSFALVAFPRTDRATEAALKYFVFGSLAEAVMTFGLSYWFGGTGTTDLAGLARFTGQLRLAAIAGLLGAVVGLGYKAALAPFHFWAPDAYDGGPLAVAAYISVVPKIGALFALAQIVRDLPDSAVDWRLLLAVVATLSMTFGNLAALVQRNVVRLLAYSSIAQAGYFLLAVIAVGRSTLAPQALVVFAAAYAAMNLGVFAIVGRVGRDLDDFSGFGRAAPWSGAALVLFLLSLVGVPPLAGFFGKLLLFGAAVNAGFAWLAVVAFLNSVLSLAVYLRLIVPAYQRSSRTAPALTFAGGLVSATGAALIVGLGLAVQVLVGHLT